MEAAAALGSTQDLRDSVRASLVRSGAIQPSIEKAAAPVRPGDQFGDLLSGFIQPLDDGELSDATTQPEEECADWVEATAATPRRPVKRRRAATPVKKEARKGQGPSAAKRTKAQVKPKLDSMAILAATTFCCARNCQKVVLGPARETYCEDHRYLARFEGCSEDVDSLMDLFAWR
jgi:hypothetical protein